MQLEAPHTRCCLVCHCWCCCCCRQRPLTRWLHGGHGDSSLGCGSFLPLTRSLRLHRGHDGLQLPVPLHQLTIHKHDAVQHGGWHCSKGEKGQGCGAGLVKEESSALSCCCALTTPDSKSFDNAEGDVSKATYQRVACLLWSQPRGQTANMRRKWRTGACTGRRGYSRAWGDWHTSPRNTQPSHTPLTQPRLPRRDTLCSCEVYGVRCKYGKQFPPHTWLMRCNSVWSMCPHACCTRATLYEFLPTSMDGSRGFSMLRRNGRA